MFVSFFNNFSRIFLTLLLDDEHRLNLAKVFRFFRISL